MAIRLTSTFGAILVALLVLCGNAAIDATHAQQTGNPICPTPPPGDNSNRCASTAFVKNAISTPPLQHGYIFVGDASNLASPVNGTNSIAYGNASGLTIFSNIITGQNYGSAMTGATGEVYGYSFRNSTTSASDIYDAINTTSINGQNGIESVLSVPSTATAEGAFGIASYVKNASTAAAVNTVGLFAAGMGTVANAPVWGINTLLTDNATRSTHSRTGQILIGYENDINVMGANTIAIGFSTGGNSLESPAAGSIGYVCNSLNGLAVPVVYKWPVCFSTQDGVADVAFVVGSSGASATSVPSQPIWMLYHDSGSARKIATFRAGPGTAGSGAFQMYTDDTESALEIGSSGSSRGRILLAGSTSGLTFLDVQAAASGFLTLPNATGTLVATASSPLAINATTGNLSWNGLTQYGVIYANATTGVASTAAGTSTTVLHGNASGAPTWSAVVSADLNITTTSCTNQFVTAISSGGVGTCTTDTLASAQHANQGTTTTVLHGNASGNPSWSAVSLTADITGTLAVGNGGTGITSGTSGGVPYFSASNTIASSGALAATAIVLGGGAGSAPTTSGCTIDSNSSITCTSANTFAPNAVIRNTANNAGYAALQFQKSRSGGVVQANDGVGGLNFLAHDGSSYNFAGSIQAVISGTPGTNDLPTDIVFYTVPDGSATNTEAMRLTSTQNIQVTSASIAANGSVATALTSVGPTGSHTTVQEWMIIKNGSGVTRYIPLF